MSDIASWNDLIVPDEIKKNRPPNFIEFHCRSGQMESLMNKNDTGRDDVIAFVVVVSNNIEHVYTFDTFNIEQNRDVSHGSSYEHAYNSNSVDFKLNGPVSGRFHGATAQDVADFARMRHQTLESSVRSVDIMESLRVKMALPGIASLRSAWELWKGLCETLFKGKWVQPKTTKMIRRSYRKYLKAQNEKEEK